MRRARRECSCGAFQLPPGPHEAGCDLYRISREEWLDSLPDDWDAQFDGLDIASGFDPWREQ